MALTKFGMHDDLSFGCHLYSVERRVLQRTAKRTMTLTSMWRLVRNRQLKSDQQEAPLQAGSKRRRRSSSPGGGRHCGGTARRWMWTTTTMKRCCLLSHVVMSGIAAAVVHVLRPANRAVAAFAKNVLAVLQLLPWSVKHWTAALSEYMPNGLF